MPHLSTRPAPRRWTLILLALSLGSTLAASDATTPVDELARDVTCAELLDPVTDTIGDPTGMLDASYCHSGSTVAPCDPSAETCTVEDNYTASDGDVQVSVSGTPDPGGAMFLALGRSDRSQACGRDVYVDLSVRFESEGVADLVATHRIAKSQDQVETQNGVENIQFCYSSPKPFTDRAGATVLVGLLPDCGVNGAQAPCVLSRNKNKADAVLTVSLPPGDPTWQMVIDTVDRVTG